MAKLSKKLKDNLATEIEILKGLRHPHIVQLFVCEDTASFIYLVMEYCQLSDLSQFMKKRHQLPHLPETAEIFRKYPNPEVGGLHEVLVRHFLKQIVSALKYLRKYNLIHRDIKPQNLLLNPAPTYMSRLAPEDVPLANSVESLIPAVGLSSLPMLKIADFGFARHLPSTSMAETLCGSPLYMAPEILRYEKYDARADLWSTGTVLHEMIVGKPPFKAQNHVDLLRKIEKQEDVIRFDQSIIISRPMKTLIRALLKKGPTERMTYEKLFGDPVIVDEIPGLHPEDRIQEQGSPAADAQALELSKRMARAMETEASPRSMPAPELQKKRSEDEVQRRTSRKASEEGIQQRRSIDMERRRSSAGSSNQVEAAAMKRQPSQREQSQREQQQQHRRPSIVAHITAPGRQELHQQQQPHMPTPTMARRASRSSPLSGPPLVREPTIEAEKIDRTSREARDRTAHDIAFERDYVLIEKRAVEVNAFADEIDALQGSPSHQGAMVRRATTQGQPTSITGASGSNSRAVQVIAGRAPHQRGGSFERRHPYASPQSTGNMLTKALNAANARLFGPGSSPPFGGPSPPLGYGAFPAYPTPSAALTFAEGADAKPMDEDSKLVRTLEDAACRSDVIYSYAEVKYKQLQPAPPSSQDALGIQQLRGRESTGDDETEDKELSDIAVVGVAEEALVLYVKALALLTKTIDLAGLWWNTQKARGETSSDPVSAPRGSTGSRILGVVKWSRERFNECLEKSEIAGRLLQHAQRQLPETHSSHPSNHGSTSGKEVATSADHIRITSGVTAERLMFDRAVDMSRAAAVDELVGEAIADCEIRYGTAIQLLEAVLEKDDEPLMRKPSQKKDVALDEVINGMETEDRQTVIRSESISFSFSCLLMILTIVASSHREHPDSPSCNKKEDSSNSVCEHAQACSE